MRQYGEGLMGLDPELLNIQEIAQQIRPPYLDEWYLKKPPAKAKRGATPAVGADRGQTNN